MKTKTPILPVIIAALLGAISGANAANWTGPYTNHMAANPLTNATANVLFVDNAALGGSDLLAVNGNPGFVVQSINLWNAGDTVTLTGMALPLRTLTTNGIFTITFYDLNGGANADTFDGTNNNTETLVGTATVTLSADILVATNLYAIFDSPITFTAHSTGIATRFVNSAGVTWKITTASAAPNCVRYVATTGGANGGANPSFALTLAGTATPPTATSAWTGVGGTSWATAGNWSPSALPATSGNTVLFNSPSTANLATVLNQNFNVAGVALSTPAGAVSIGGANTLTLTNGINLASAAQDLIITAPVVLGASQSWSVGSNQTLSVSGGISGSFSLSFEGAGTNALGGVGTYSGNTGVGTGGTLRMAAANVLPGGSGKGNVVVNGTLDLNGYSQAINALSGGGVVDNTAAGAATLTVGNNDATNTITGILQNTGGALALVKTGTNSLALTGANTFSGGFINNSVCTVSSGNAAGTNNCFGTGPVVMNAGTIYMTATNWIFTNALTLNGATLRVGGANSHVLTWSGPVSVTADSTLSADGSTAGIVLSGGLAMNNNCTLTSVGAGGPIAISNSISGATGTIIANASAGVFFNLYAANTFGGTFRATNGTLKIFDVLAMQNATLDMNAADSGSVSLNNLSATIGALTGSRDLFLGNNVVSVGNNSGNTTYSGVLSGTGSLKKIGSGVLTLDNASTYTGNTTVTAGTLALSGSGSIASTNFIVAGGATLAVSATTPVFALGSRTLTNSSAGAILNGTNDCTGGTLSLLYNGVNPSFIITNGGMTLSGSTVIQVKNTGASLSGGSHTIISAATTGNHGLVAGTLPAVTVTGNGASGAASLQINGTGGLDLVVASSIASNPTNISFTVSSGTLTMTWPGDHLGWIAQSNSVNLGNTNFWFDVPNSQLSTNLVITINPGKANVFYRLRYPN